MNIISRILLTALTLLILAYYVPGIEVDGVYIAIVSAIILGLLNGIVRPVLFILTLPITLLTLGIFSFIINALLFWFASSFIDGFSVSGFWVALFGSVILSLVSTATNKLLD
jgi:putative membrane protein